MRELSKKLLYNPNGTDTDRHLIGGDTTNLLNLHEVKYPWAVKIWDTMLQNHWIPEKSPMTEDKESFKLLTPDEQEAYLKIISFLIFLDSIQTNNVPNITEYVTSSEVVLALSRQTFDEALHSKSYGHILTSIFNKEQANKAIYYWRDDPVLRARNEYIAGIYQSFSDKPTLEGYIKVLMANYLLEGVYFYNGFQFFYNLESRHLMPNTAVQIRYIQRDEIQHCLLFKNIIRTIQEEEPELWAKVSPELYVMVEEAVEQEITFSNHVIGDKILGITTKSITDYTHYIANRRLKDIRMEPVFPKTKNPYEHLEKLAGTEDETTSKTNIFESQSIAYKQATILKGWDLI